MLINSFTQEVVIFSKTKKAKRQWTAQTSYFEIFYSDVFNCEGIQTYFLYNYIFSTASIIISLNKYFLFRSFHQYCIVRTNLPVLEATWTSGKFKNDHLKKEIFRFLWLFSNLD